MPVRITEIKHIYGKGHMHMIHTDILKKQICKYGFFSASAPCLYAYTAVRACKYASGNMHIANASCDFGSYSHRTVAFFKPAVPDRNILSLSVMILCHIELSALKCDAVITY